MSGRILEKVIELAFASGERSMQVFVASFSAVEDQLSQWRGYSYGSSGVSIGFQLGALRPPAGTDTMVTFAPCIYAIEKKQALVRRAFSHFLDEGQVLWSENDKMAAQFVGAQVAGEATGTVEEFAGKYLTSINFAERITAAVSMTAVELLRIAALLKNESFSEEQEWRLVLPVLADQQKLLNPLRFRAKSSTLVPYIAHPISPDPALSLPLVDLILGPGSHPNATHAATDLLKSRGINVIPRLSSVPYQPW